ncbi:pilus (MSHA type) biogenesis protein MshL [Thiomicrorhabdus heinhorstiae]|uniref:Pilus (MSHA type) biogenesis protein MshL n=1 Tax=Thiomicrorhabdus heinhorstiae TaxID=2748010 RepID=A0ABS0BXE7_9GAMM|nr:pilus (MSHA type) biogenesis protein MshL [Thiomicrorhabdus heinhorstiae]MBF6058435.1 pilus (MSHA type) biogenesis protein MshL [Thiomicrorhabdus heinhorstiae]
MSEKSIDKSAALLKHLETKSQNETLQVVQKSLVNKTIPEVDPLPDNSIYSKDLFSLNANKVSLLSLLTFLAERFQFPLATDISSNYRVSMNALDISFLELLKLLRNQGVAYQIDQRGIFVYLAKPYWKTYPIDYVHLEKSGADNIDMKMSVSSTPVSTSSPRLASGTRVKVESRHNFWKTLEANLQSFLVTENQADQRFLINPESGVLSLYADEDTHQSFKKFLTGIRARIKRQVLIEATVVEVTLNDQFKAGIDWSLLNPSLFGNSGGLAFHVPFQSADGSVIFETLASSGEAGAVKFGSFNLLASLQLLEQFGDSKVLSSPKIMALNNQTALLKVVNNLVYFTVDVNTTAATANSAATTTYETEVHTVPVGFTLSVTPFVGDNDQITLNIRPTISRHIGQVADPNPELNRLDVQSFIPVIQEKEMSSVLKLRNGQLAMIGGLIEDLNSDDNNQLPFLADLPVIGAAFQSKSRERSRTELVIFIRPLIVES